MSNSIETTVSAAIKAADMACDFQACSIDKLMSWENGELDEQETITLFQALINTGMAWSLQGMYGRTASRMIEDGLCMEATY